MNNVHNLQAKLLQFTDKNKTKKCNCSNLNLINNNTKRLKI